MYGPITAGHAQVHTSIGEIKEIFPHGRDIWCATDGGVAKWNTVTMSYAVFTTVDGVGYNEIKDIAVASDSTVWAATWGGGVSKYDGTAWTTYTSDDGLGEDYISNIRIAPDGTVWAASFRKGISYFDGSGWVTFTTEDGLPSDQNDSLGIAPDGTVWASQSVDGEGSLCRFDGIRWQRYEPEEFFPNYGINCIEFDPDGNMWLGINSYIPETKNLIVKIEGDEITTYSIDDGLIVFAAVDIAFSPDGTVWTAMSEGINSFDGNQWVTHRPETIFTTVAVDDYGNLWTGTWARNNGLIRFDGTEWEVFRDDFNIAGNNVYSMTIDTEGMIWAGTRYGISRYDGESWYTFTSADGLPYDEVVKIVADPDGGVWAAMTTFENNALAYFNGHSWQTVESESLDGSYITALEIDKKGTLWIGTLRRVEIDGGKGFDGSVVCFDGETWESYTVDTGSPYNGVTSLSVGPDNTIWAGTQNAVLHYDRSEWTYHFSQPGLPDDEVMAIEATSDGTVYVALGSYGISRFRNNTWEIFLNEDSDIDPVDTMTRFIGVIEETPDGLIWFADGSGVFYFDGVRFGLCTSVTGEAISMTQSITATDDMVLFGTEMGVYSYSMKPSIFKSAVREEIITGVDKNDQWYKKPVSLAVFPNPFNSGTEISYTLPHEGAASLYIYNVMGQRIATLVEGMFPAGYHTVSWNGTDDNGTKVSSGIYIARIRQKESIATSRLMLLK